VVCACRLERLEATVREKEQLAEGLHLIDFEQLKIENQSLTEKIEERNEELLKLKRKITTTVQARSQWMQLLGARLLAALVPARPGLSCTHEGLQRPHHAAHACRYSRTCVRSCSLCCGATVCWCARSGS
jgi:hypothetical protein